MRTPHTAPRGAKESSNSIYDTIGVSWLCLLTSDGDANMCPMFPNANTNSVVNRMFVQTADHNYAMARWAFFNELNEDFFWLGLHASEKYLKAILLINGVSSKKYGHDIVKLHSTVLNYFPEISFGDLEKPSQVPYDIQWTDECLISFIKRLNWDGNPNNRYLVNGYRKEPDDLLKLDQLVWKIRRYCRSFESLHPNQNDDRFVIKCDWLSELNLKPSLWKLSGANLIEKALNGNLSQDIQSALFTDNLAFAPDRTHSFKKLKFEVANPPLSNWVDHPETGIAKSVIQWTLDNISLSKEAEQELKNKLNS